jgi:glutamate-1-semialdehyde aminotransferase
MKIACGKSPQLGRIHMHSVGANGSFRVQGKARRRRQWIFHGETPQRRHAPGKARSLRVAAKSAGCVVALLDKGAAIDFVARLAANAFGHNASDRMHMNTP